MDRATANLSSVVSGSPEQAPSPGAGLMAALRRAAKTTRGRRVVYLLLLLWVLNLFALTATILAHQIGGFAERNPIARQMLDASWLLTTFKLSMVGLGSVILFLLRRHRLTEMVCWLLAMVYTALAFSWLTYYSLRL